MPVATEVDAFQSEVGRDQNFVSRREPQHGAIVSDSGNNRRIQGLSAPSRHAANLGNQRFFGNRHGVNTIAESPPPNRARQSSIYDLCSPQNPLPWDTPVMDPPVTTVTGASVTSEGPNPSLTGGTWFATFYQAFTKTFGRAKFCKEFRLQRGTVLGSGRVPVGRRAREKFLPRLGTCPIRSTVQGFCNHRAALDFRA